MTSNQEFWQYNEEAEDKWIIKALRPKFNLFNGLIEYNQELDAFYFHKSIVTTGGVVMYAKDGVDTEGEGSGVASSVLWENIQNKPDWLEDDKIHYEEVEGLEDTFVTRAGNEDVTGVHDFTNGLKIGGISLYNSQEDVVYVEGNLIVKGGVTMYAVDSTTADTILSQLPIASTSGKGIASFDEEHFTVINGKVSLITKNTGEGIDESRLEEYLTENGYAT